ncbi:hypothetical protein [Cellulosimicrobium protaetiae]
MTLLLKLVMAPALVVASTLAGRRWGARLTGVLVGLPVVAGPILLIATLDHGTAFGAAAASSALLGLTSLALFAVVFGWCSRRTGWVGALAASWAACLVADVALARLTLPAGIAFVVALATFWGASRAMPPDVPDTSPPVVAAPWWDLPARAAATATLVLAVTTASGALGPAMTGVLAPFPIASSVVAAFALAQRGSAETVRLLRGLLAGLTGFAVFCLLVAILVDGVGIAVAFGIALVASVAVQAVVPLLGRLAARAAGRRARY